MARQKGYDREQAINRARDAFREHGYQNLGIRAIEELVGIGRFAIRTDFNGKEGLFKEALAQYQQDAFKDVIEPIAASDNLSALEVLLQQSLNPNNDKRRKHGCMLINTMIETPTHQNPAFNQYTQANFDDLKQAVCDLVEKAKANGSAKLEINSEHAGEIIKGAIIAINVINRDANDVHASATYIESILALIASWKTDQS